MWIENGNTQISGRVTMHDVHSYSTASHSNINDYKINNYTTLSSNGTNDYRLKCNAEKTPIKRM